MQYITGLFWCSMQSYITSLIGVLCNILLVCFGVLCNIILLVWLVFYAILYYWFDWCLCNIILLVWLVFYAILYYWFDWCLCNIILLVWPVFYAILYYWFDRCSMQYYITGLSVFCASYVQHNNTGIINSWTLKGAIKKIATVEMWLYRRLDKVSWTERQSNE